MQLKKKKCWKGWLNEGCDKSNSEGSRQHYRNSAVKKNKALKEVDEKTVAGRRVRGIVGSNAHT